MNTCKTCAHWIDPAEGDDWNKNNLTGYFDPITFEPIPAPFEVRICEHPGKRFCARPVEPNGFAIADGSTYFAALATAEDFGCVRHETVAAQAKEQ